VGPARACQLLAALELGRRAARPRPPEGRPLRQPADAAAQLDELAQLEQEELHVVALDAAHRPIARFVAARGALNVVHVTPREVLRRLVREGAAAAIVAHNHPSGDPTPSRDDRELTLRLRAAGELVGVAILDHLVIARGGFYSFARDGPR
jgi:DNA repair protein RadC